MISINRIVRNRFTTMSRKRNSALVFYYSFIINRLNNIVNLCLKERLLYNLHSLKYVSHVLCITIFP